MTEKSCEKCKYTGVQVTRWPCKTCGPFMKHFTPLKPNYGSCRGGFITPDGNCGVFEKQTPCLQWDCHLWSNEPAKAAPVDDDETRLKWLVAEFIRLMDLYAEESDPALRVAWHNDIAPALIDRIEARARAAFGGE